MKASEKSGPSSRASAVDPEAMKGGGDQPGEEEWPGEVSVLSSKSAMVQDIMGDILEDAADVGDVLSDIIQRAEKEIDHRETIAEAKHIVSDILLDAFEEVEQREREKKWPSLARDKRRAIAFLQRTSSPHGISLYDHISMVINKVLAEKPDNVLEHFEEYSKKLKEERFHPQDDYLRDVYVPPEQIELANKKQQLFKSLVTKEEAGEQGDVVKSEEEGIIGPNLLNQLHYFQEAGVALPRKEVFLIQVAIRRLVRDNKTISKYRFWGKILGLQKNYIIVEVVQKDEEYTRRIQEIQEQKKQQEMEKQTESKISAAEIAPAPPPSPEPEAGGESAISGPPPIPRRPVLPIPQSTYQPPPEVPTEQPGEGVNAKVYYVTNAPEDDWIMLPDVTPQQLDVARKTRRYFTGNLEAEIETFPVFPGNEGNYLRAQIARISAGTQVSPRGYFRSGEMGGEGGEEEEEGEAGEGAGTGKLTENPFYQPVPVKDLVDGSLAFWVHHTPYILKQGRTTWWNPGGKVEIKGEGEGGEAGEGGEGEETEHVEPEMGPAILTPLSEDVSTENIKPWTVRPTSELTPEFAAATIRSNLWPGAFAIAAEKVVENLYVGWGQKYVSLNYTPPAMDPIQSEYPLGPEIMEIQDPTVEEEEAWRLAHLPKRPIMFGEGGEGGEGGEAEEEEDEEEE